jgi:hypothetical protein
MSDEFKLTCRYRILRYVPNLIRDEWVNVGVLLEELPSEGAAPTRVAMRLIEENSELARVRRIHPAVDEEMLRALLAEFQKRLRAAAPERATYLTKLDQTLSNVLQFSPETAVFTDDFDSELDRLYRERVSPPARRGHGVLQSGLEWIRARVQDIFRRHRVLGRLEKRVPVAEFTYPGDPLALDYGYRNGVRGFVHAVTINRDLARAKALAYTAERVRRRIADAEFTAITETEPASGNSSHEFVSQLFADQRVAIVPLSRAESFAETLRQRLS